MYWFHVVSVERSKAIYNSWHIEYIGFMSWLSKDDSNRYINGTTLFKLHVVTVETYNTKYNKIPHILLVSCHVCQKALIFLRITMYILIQSLQITIFFRIKASNYTKLRIKPSNYKHFELNYM